MGKRYLSLDAIAEIEDGSSSSASSVVSERRVKSSGAASDHRRHRLISSMTKCDILSRSPPVKLSLLEENIASTRERIEDDAVGAAEEEELLLLTGARTPCGIPAHLQLCTENRRLNSRVSELVRLLGDSEA